MPTRWRVKRGRSPSHHRPMLHYQHGGVFVSARKRQLRVRVLAHGLGTVLLDRVGPAEALQRGLRRRRDNGAASVVIPHALGERHGVDDLPREPGRRAAHVEEMLGRLWHAPVGGVALGARERAEEPYRLSRAPGWQADAARRLGALKAAEARPADAVLRRRGGVNQRLAAEKLVALRCREHTHAVLCAAPKCSKQSQARIFFPPP